MIRRKPNLTHQELQNRRQFADALHESIYAMSGRTLRRPMLMRFIVPMLVGVALMLVAMGARASDIAFISNRAGGQIVLTDAKIPICQGAMAAFTRAPGGRTLFGCWAASNQHVTIEWADGDIRTYPVASFLFYDGDAEAATPEFGSDV